MKNILFGLLAELSFDMDAGASGPTESQNPKF